jgi:hypothetical protein
MHIIVAIEVPALSVTITAATATAASTAVAVIESALTSHRVSEGSISPGGSHELEW